jgi:hypothetical protein
MSVPATAEDDLLGPPPVISGEDPSAFLELLQGMRDEVKPRGIIEDIFVRDSVDLIWEIRRLRRLKAALLQAAAHEGLEQVLTSLLPWADARELVKGWMRGNSTAIRRVDNMLAGAGLTRDAILAEALAARLREIEGIERMIASNESRLQAVLREIDRHRAALAAALRSAAHAAEAEDAEFTDLTPRDVAA